MSDTNEVQPQWRATLEKSLYIHREMPHAKFFQVANVDNEGFAQNRSMVFRGFVDSTNILLAITDIRSDKIQQWQNHPYAHITWYFTQTREQYRLSCNVLMISHADKNEKLNLPRNSVSAPFNNILAQTLRSEVWQNLSAASKAQFTWPTPKQAIHTQSDEQQSDTNETQAVSLLKDESLTPHENFVVVCFIPQVVDYLNLKSSPQIRQVSQFDASTLEQSQQWNCIKVNP